MCPREGLTRRLNHKSSKLLLHLPVSAPAFLLHFLSLSLLSGRFICTDFFLSQLRTCEKKLMCHDVPNCMGETFMPVFHCVSPFLWHSLPTRASILRANEHLGCLEQLHSASNLLKSELFHVASLLWWRPQCAHQNQKNWNGSGHHKNDATLPFYTGTIWYKKSPQLQDAPTFSSWKKGLNINGSLGSLIHILSSGTCSAQIPLLASVNIFWNGREHLQQALRLGHIASLCGELNLSSTSPSAASCAVKGYTQCRLKHVAHACPAVGSKKCGWHQQGSSFSAGMDIIDNHKHPTSPASQESRLLQTDV